MAVSAEDRRGLLTEDDSESEVYSDDLSTRAQSSRTWELDDAVRNVGFGRYQFVLWFFLCLVSMSCGFNNMAMVFEGGNGGYTCYTPDNSTNNQSVTEYIPGACSYTKKVFYANGTNTTDGVKCDRWIYNRTVFNSTINSEWDLACDREYLSDLSSTIYMLGFFTGCIILGDLADRFGRRLLLLLSVLLTFGTALGAAYSPSYALFVVLRFFVGVGVAGSRNSAYIMAAEFARPKDRGTLGLISDMTYSVAYILTGFIFYLDPNWRKLQLYIALSHILYLLYVFFLPESPRWLLSRGKTEEAMKYFRTSAKINGKHLPSNVTIVLDQPPQQSHSVLDLVRTPNLRKVGIVSLILWFIVSLVYFGMSYNVGNLQGSIYINNAILGGVELVANCSGIWIVMLGRPPAILISFIIAAGSMLIMCFTLDSRLAVIILAMLGKFVISPCFSYIYISTTELYPTQTRTLALGIGSGVARLGGAIAPFIPLTVALGSRSPYIIFAVCSAVGALTVLLLPETKNRPLPDSIASAEKVNVVRCGMVCTCCAGRTSAINESGDEAERQHVST